MSKLITFFRTLVNSFLPKYYADVYKAKFSFSFKYFLVFHILIALITTVTVLIPVVNFNPESYLDEVVEQIPKNLKFELTDGVLSLNRPLPYSIPIPEGDDGSYGKRNVENVVTFVKDEDFKGVAEFNNFKSMIVVTETAVYAMKATKSNEVRAYAFPIQDESIVLSTDDVPRIQSLILTHPIVAQKWYIPLIGAAVFILVYVGALAWHLLTLVFFSILSWLILKLVKSSAEGLEMGFSKTFQFGMHLTTGLWIIDYVLTFVGLSISGIPYLLAFMASMVMVSITAGKELKMIAVAPSSSILHLETGKGSSK